MCFIPATVLLDAGVGRLRGWHPERGHVWILAGLGLWLAIVGLTALFARRWMGRNAPQICMLIIVTLLMLLGANWVVGRVVTRREAEQLKQKQAATQAATQPAHMHLRPPNTRLEFKPTPALMPGVAGTAAFQINSKGLRGSEMPPRERAYRIIAVGGSTTECSYLDETEAWPRLVADGLTGKWKQEVWVGGAGISGHRMPHHYDFAAKADVVGEVDCLLVLAGINDLAYEVSSGSPPPLRASKSRARETTRRKRRGEAEAAAAAAKKAEPLFARLAMVKELQRVLATLPEELMAEDVQGKRYDARRKLRLASEKVDALEPLEQALKTYRELLVQLVQTCKARKLRLVLLTQPVMWSAQSTEEQEKLFWFGWRREGGYVSTRALREGMDRYNAVTMEVARESGVECIDLSPMSGTTEYYYDDCHFNEAGAREVARRVVEAMKK